MKRSFVVTMLFWAGSLASGAVAAWLKSPDALLLAGILGAGGAILLWIECIPVEK